ncbi:MAG: hypothetical protein AAF196_19635 [Planctomycetota bacterium]
MIRSIIAVTSLSAVLVTTGCAREASADFAPLSHPLEAGSGLGEIRLGQTTFLDCLVKYPKAKATFAASDDGYLAELFFPRIALRMTFPMGRESLQTMELSTLKRLVIDAENTARANPTIAQARLSNIWFGTRGRSDDPDEAQPCGGIALDGATYPGIQIGASFDQVVAALGEGDTPQDPTLPEDPNDGDGDEEPKYRTGEFNLRWEGLTLGFTKPTHSDPYEQPYLISVLIYQPYTDE